MFSKSNTNASTNGRAAGRATVPATTMADHRSAPAAAQGRPAQVTILAADLVFEGSITGEGELVIDGAVKGDIHVSRVLIGEYAHVEGTVRAASVEVRGRVIGNIEGKAIHLLPTAHMEGDITHEQLSIDIGAFFQGRCWQFRGQASGQNTNPMAEVIPLEAKQN